MYNLGGRQPPGDISQSEVHVEKYTPFRATRAQILKEVYHPHLLDIPPPIEQQLCSSQGGMMQVSSNLWPYDRGMYGVEELDRTIDIGGLLGTKGKMKSTLWESSLGRIGAELREETVTKSRIDLLAITRIQRPNPPLGNNNNNSWRRFHDKNVDISPKKERLGIRQDLPVTFTNEDYEGRSHGNLDNNSQLPSRTGIGRPRQLGQRAVLASFRKLRFFKIKFGRLSRNFDRLRGRARTGSTRKAVKMTFTMVNSLTSYNVILDRPTLNLLRAIVSTTHLCMKYSVNNLVGVICANQRVTRKCYDKSTHVSGSRQGGHITLDEQLQVHFLELDPRFYCKDARPQSDEGLKEIQVGLKLHQWTKIGVSLDLGVEEEVV
ncbi:hypothetical protein CR513_28484, partial [Mucuna pruriens]